MIKEPHAGQTTGETAPSFSSFLHELRGYPQAELLVIDKPVKPAEFEVTALVRHLEVRHNFPALLFTRPSNLMGQPSDVALATNLFATRELCAAALGLPPHKAGLDLSLLYARLQERLLPPVEIGSGAAPVKEVILAGEQADLRTLPLVRHHEMDPAPYIDMVVVAREPDQGFYNMSFQRAMYKGPRRTGLYMAPRHNWEILRRYRSANKFMPVAIVTGHHPAFFLGSVNVHPFGVNDYAAVGSFLGQPLRLTSSETWGSDFLVPADADLVIEGEVPPDELEAEGLFGEWTSFYGPQRLSPVVNVTAITRRRHATHQDVMVSHRDDCILGALGKEAAIYNAIKASIPTVKAVHLGMSGNARFNVYVSLSKKVEGEAMWAGVIAASVFNNFKLIIVVDEDIDVFSEEEVWFAVAMRAEMDRDIQVLKDIKSSPLDPAMSHPTKKALAIIDATKPLDRPMPERVRVPAEVLQRLNLEEFVPADQLRSLRMHPDWNRSM